MSSSLPFASLLGKYAGGVRVDENFSKYLYAKLREGEARDQGEIEAMLADGLRDFQRLVKLDFLSPADVGKVQVGIRHLNDDSLRIKRGVMSIPGYDATPHRRAISRLTLLRPGKTWKVSSSRL